MAADFDKALVHLVVSGVSAPEDRHSDSDPARCQWVGYNPDLGTIMDTWGDLIWQSL